MPRSGSRGLRLIAFVIGVAAVVLGVVGGHDFWVSPSARWLPRSVGVLMFVSPAMIAIGITCAYYALIGTPTRRSLLRIGAIFLLVAAIGVLWRSLASQERGFLGSMLVLVAFPVGVVFVVAGLALRVASTSASKLLGPEE